MSNGFPQHREYFTIEGRRIAYLTMGDPTAPALVLIHGWMAAMADWHLFLPELTANYHCILVDLLGHGHSDKPHDGDYSIPAQARRVMAVVDELDVDDFLLCGHSMGGMIAFYITAILAPARVQRLVNLAGIVHKNDWASWLLVWISTHIPSLVDLYFMFTRWMVKFPWGQWLLTSTILHNWQRPQGYAQNLCYSVQPGMETPFWRAVEAILALDMLPHLSQIACPVLTMVGQQDLIVSFKQVQLAEAHIPHQTVHILPKCGHHLMLEKPAACLEKIHPFLAGQSRK